MEDEPAMCIICHESMESFHTVVQPTNCTHKFHVICITIWLSHHRTCPLCRTPISYRNQIMWRSVFLTALTITREMVIERCAYTYAFLSLLLRQFPTAQLWLQHRESIVRTIERFNVADVRLPCLDITSRTMAKREKRRWAKQYSELEEGALARTSERVALARRMILDYNVLPL